MRLYQRVAVNWLRESALFQLLSLCLRRNNWHLEGQALMAQNQLLLSVVLNCAQEGVVDILEDLVLFGGHFGPVLLVCVI